MHAGERWRLGHRPGLDGLRGVAVLLVVIAHAVDHWWNIGLGFAGVCAFFTLSGFLITSLLIGDQITVGRIRWAHFYARRARRLLPAMVVMVAIVGGFQITIGMSDWRSEFAAMTYIANWADLGGLRLALLGHTWSLAVEEQFYLVWPIVFAMLAGRWRALMAVLTIGALASAAARVVLWDGGEGWRRIALGTDTRGDALLVGCGLALLVNSGWKPRVPRFAPTAMAVTFLVYMLATPSVFSTTVIVPTVAPWLTAALILASLDRPGWLGARWLTWWGARSYGIYLWHLPLIYTTAALTDSPLWTAVAGAVSLGIAELSWRFVEQPFLRDSMRLSTPKSVREERDSVQSHVGV